MLIRASYNLSVDVDNQCESHLAQITKYIIIIIFSVTVVLVLQPTQSDQRSQGPKMKQCHY